MKIFFIINSLIQRSGIERVACILANLCVSKLGSEASIFSRDTDKFNVAYHLDDSVNVIKLSGSYFDFYNQLNLQIKNEKPDYILVHNMGRLSLLCSMLKLNQGCKLISLEHVAFDVRPLWVKLFSKILYKKISQVITLTKKDMIPYLKFHHHISQINNISPFDVNFINDSYSVQRKKIVSVGRLTYQKNFKSLLHAWNIIFKDYPDWSLEIYGIGEEESKLIDFINNHNLERVSLKGQTSDVKSVYESAGVYVMSSRFEGLPMVLIEAQSFGLPIVSYDCPHGPAEIIDHNNNGYLVENQNFVKLAESLKILISSDSLRLEFSKNARKHALVYSSAEVLLEWKKVFN